MKREDTLLTLLAVSIILSITVMSLQANTLPPQDSPLQMGYHSMICKQVTRVNGTIESAECSHNTLTNTGANASRNSIGNGTGVAFDYIALGNLSGGDDKTITTLAGEQTQGGLARARGMYFSQGTVGNWTISKTFTATATMQVNTTALFNASSTGAILNVNNFTSATLQTDDQITVNHTIWIS